MDGGGGVHFFRALRAEGSVLMVVLVKVAFFCYVFCWQYIFLRFLCSSFVGYHTQEKWSNQ